MRFEIPESPYHMAFTMSERRVKCSLVWYGRSYAVVGDIVVANGGRGEMHLHRVLGRVESPSHFKGHLVTIRLTMPSLFGALAFVDPTAVYAISDTPSKFMEWFFQEKWPRADHVIELADYGTLCETSISEASSHLRALEKGEDPFQPVETKKEQV